MIQGFAIAGAGGTGGGGATASLRISAGTLSALRTDVTFSNSNGVTFGLNTNGVITATVATNYQSSGAYLTTAALSQDSSKYAGTNFATTTSAGSVVAGTMNTSGLTLGIPAYLTTADLSQNSSRYAGTGFTTATTAGTVIVGTLSTNGLSMGVPAFLTTAALSQDSSKYAGTAFATTTSAGAVIAGTLNTSGMTLGVPSFLTTAALSQDSSKYAGTNFATTTGGGVTIGGTMNTSGLTLAVPSIQNNVASLWANFPALLVTGTTMAQSNSWYVFPITLAHHISASYIRLLASFNFTSTTIATSAVNNVTGASTAFSETVAFNAVIYRLGIGGNSRSLQEQFSASAGLTWAVSVSQASTSNASQQSITQRLTFPNEGFTTATTSTQYSVSATNGPISTTQWSNFTAQRFLDIPFATSMTMGNYWVAINRFSGTAGGFAIDCNATLFGNTQQNLTFANLNSATNLSNAAPQPGVGVWTTNVAATSSSIALASISVTTSYVIPMMQMINQA